MSDPYKLLGTGIALTSVKKVAQLCSLLVAYLPTPAVSYLTVMRDATLRLSSPYELHDLIIVILPFTCQGHELKLHLNVVHLPCARSAWPDDCVSLCSVTLWCGGVNSSVWLGVRSGQHPVS